MSSAKLTLRPPPHLDFIQGFPGIPSSPSSSRPPAHLSGTIELRPGPKPLFARYLHLELKKVETLPPSSSSSSSSSTTNSGGGGGGSGGNKFTELIGAGPTELWTSAGGGGGGKAWTQLGLRDFAFTVPVPEGLPPSVTVDAKGGAGIAYHLHATLCVRPKPKKSRRASAFFFSSSPKKSPASDGEDSDSTTDPPVFLTASAPVRIVKHDLHAPWPCYHPQPPELRETTKGGVALGVTRFATAAGPGDELWTRVRVESALVRPIRIVRFEISLREIVRFRYGGGAGGQGTTTDQRMNAVFEVHAKLNKTLYHKETHSFDIKALVPSLSSSSSGSQQKLTVTTAKHITIEYLLKVRALIDLNGPGGTGAGGGGAGAGAGGGAGGGQGVESGPEGGEIVIDWMPVVMGDRGGDEARRTVDRIGRVEKLDRPSSPSPSPSAGPHRPTSMHPGPAPAMTLPLDRRSSQLPPQSLDRRTSYHPPPRSAGPPPPPPPSVVGSDVTPAGSRTGVGTLSGPIGRAPQLAQQRHTMPPGEFGEGVQGVAATTGRRGAPGGRGGMFAYPEEVGYERVVASQEGEGEARYATVHVNGDGGLERSWEGRRETSLDRETTLRGRDPRIRAAFPDRADAPVRPDWDQRPASPPGSGLPVRSVPDKGAGVVVDYGAQRSARTSLDGPGAQRLGMGARTASGGSVSYRTVGEGGVGTSVQEKIRESKRRIASISRPSSAAASRDGSPPPPPLPLPEDERGRARFVGAEEEKRRLYEQAKAVAEGVQAGGSGGVGSAPMSPGGGEGGITPTPARWASAEEEKRRLFEDAKRQAASSSSAAGGAAGGSGGGGGAAGWASAAEEKRLFEEAKRQAEETAARQAGVAGGAGAVERAGGTGAPGFESAQDEKKRYEMARRRQEEAERTAREFHAVQQAASQSLPYETRPAPMSPRPAMQDFGGSAPASPNSSSNHVAAVRSLHGSPRPPRTAHALHPTSSSSSSSIHRISSIPLNSASASLASSTSPSSHHAETLVDPEREAYLKAVAEREAFVASKTGSPVVSEPQKLAYESALEEKVRLRQKEEEARSPTIAPSSSQQFGYQPLVQNAAPRQPTQQQRQSTLGVGFPPHSGPQHHVVRSSSTYSAQSSGTASSGAVGFGGMAYQRDPDIKAGKARAVESSPEPETLSEYASISGHGNGSNRSWGQASPATVSSREGTPAHMDSAFTNSPTDEPGYIPWHQQPYLVNGFSSMPPPQPLNGVPLNGAPLNGAPLMASRQGSCHDWLAVRPSTPFDMGQMMGGFGMQWSNSDQGYGEPVRAKSPPPPLPPKIPIGQGY